MKTKILMFVLSLLSLAGIFFGFIEYKNSYNTELSSFFFTWFLFSIPLIVQLIFLRIFGDGSKR